MASFSGRLGFEMHAERKRGVGMAQRHLVHRQIKGRGTRGAERRDFQQICARAYTGAARKKAEKSKLVSRRHVLRSNHGADVLDAEAAAASA